jgi:dolichyl-phosphate beta-glucosyltransferase
VGAIHRGGFNLVRQVLCDEGEIVSQRVNNSLVCIRRTLLLVGNGHPPIPACRYFKLCLCGRLENTIVNFTLSTIVVPCYNEANRLNVTAFRSFIESSPEIKFVFVNDGSTDATLDVLQSLRDNAGISATILNLPVNGGKAEAVRQGLVYALDQSPESSVVGFWDADLSTPLEAIHDLLGIMKETPQVQFVFGSRVKLLGRQIDRLPIRHYLGRVFATAASVVLRLPIYDTQCGAKLFRSTPELRQILAAPFESRWVFDVELIARFMQLHKSDPGAVAALIYEFPLYAWQDVAGSKLRPKDFIRAIYELFSIYRRYH